MLSVLRVQVQSLVRGLRSQATKCKFTSAFSLPRTCGLLPTANYILAAFADLPAHLPCSLCSRILDSLNSLNTPPFSPQGFPCKLIPQFGAVCSLPLPSFVQSRLSEGLTATFLGRSFLSFFFFGGGEKLSYSPSPLAELCQRYHFLLLHNKHFCFLSFLPFKFKLKEGRDFAHVAPHSIPSSYHRVWPTVND